MSGLAELRARLANATPRPWAYDEQTMDLYGGGEEEPCIGCAITNAAGALIVAAVNALPGLLAVYDAAEKVMPPTRQVGCSSNLCALRAAVDALKEEKG